MAFITGNDNSAQWVALSINIVNIIYSYFRTKSNSIGSFGIFTYWVRVILGIAFIAIYYIVRVNNFKDGNKDWNWAYFIASVALLFLKGT